MVDRGELRSVYERVVTCLEPRGTWDGDEKDASWPRDFLRPTGTAVKPLEEEEEVGEGTALNGPERHDNREYGGADDQDQSPLETQPSEEHVLQDEESVVVDRATE
ncbi:hypothetical protein FRC17_009147 [Serendipita sp. 399]|nr:hypothetical protein FRC17_009147 [Serendipita sp. 399]